MREGFFLEVPDLGCREWIHFAALLSAKELLVV